MQWTWEFGDDLDRYIHKAGLNSAQLSRESGVDPAEISRLRWGDGRLSGKKVCHRLPYRLSCILRVFIHKGAITSTAVVEEWLIKLPYGCLDEKRHRQIIQEAENELAAMRAVTGVAKGTGDPAVTPSKAEGTQAYEYDNAEEESTYEELVARRNALLRELAHIDQLMERKGIKP